ncbi:MAG: M48 family metallopeptidase [Candidatus Omnitrophica bacterium]|nr:M48 family metallopeptidase [Candidatus Omnitrophota bacterium]MCF7878130.1 M48 family metallopeptidase [Candidatus Omnitrophota bacterium]MCF7893303.1 M48 family metallopeptidase [Candidatus Omnitrophota bacterium]
MNIYLVIILTILIGGYLLSLLVEGLNIRAAGPRLPDEFVGYYDPEKYKKSQEYLRENTSFNLIHSGLITLLLVAAILTGFFNWIDGFVRSFNFALISTGLLFALIVFLIIEIINLPFSIYHTFGLEQKYGFNRTTPKIFITDKIKGLIIGIILGAIILSFLFWFFDKFKTWGWVFCWLALTLLELFLLFIWPRFIMPLFNKFEPVEEGELREKIKTYANRENFKIQGIYKMDASKRSTKSNAFFAGFGKFKRIVLFDTLIENHSPDEIVSILAHEVGHYKKKHILEMISISFITNGFMFYLLSLFITNPGLFRAFKMDNISVYAGLFFFGFLYTPINSVFSVFVNQFSRKNEKEADFFAVKSSQLGSQFIKALKKLSVKNLSNLTPHPVKVLLSYSHPPVLERIKYIRHVSRGTIR